MIDENVRRLMVAIDRIDSVYYRVQRESGMKDSLFVLAYALADGKPRSQKRIREEWAIPRSTLNTTVIEQAKQGNVELVASGHKEKFVQLTDRGRRAYSRELGRLLDAERAAALAVDAESLAEQMERFAAVLEDGMSRQGETADQDDERE